MPSFLIPEMLAAQLGFTGGVASLEQLAGQVTSLLENARVVTVIGEGHAASLRAALGGEGTVEEGQVIEALRALLAAKGDEPVQGAAEILRPRVVLREGWEATVREIFEEDATREVVEGVIRKTVGSLNRSKSRDHIRREQVRRALEAEVAEPDRRQALEAALIDFLGAFAVDLGLPPLEEPPPAKKKRGRETLPPAVQERLKAQLRSLLDQIAPLVERLHRLCDRTDVGQFLEPPVREVVEGIHTLESDLAPLREELGRTSGIDLIDLRRRCAAYRVRALRLYEQLLHQDVLRALLLGDAVQAETSVRIRGAVEFVRPAPTDSMADFLTGLGFDRADPSFADAAGVIGATVFGWGDRSLPFDLGFLGGAFLYINEDLAARSASEGEGAIQQVDPFDFLRLAFGERGEAFFASLQGENEIVIRYPAYWGEFPYGEIGVPFALGKAREHLAATDSDLARSVDEVIDETTVADHRRGRVAQPQRMWPKTRAAFTRIFASKGERGEAYGEALLFFLTYLPFVSRWIPVTDGRVALNDADKRLTRWRIQLIPEDAEPAIGIDVGQRYLFSRPPFSYLAEGRIGRLLDETERRLLLYRYLTEETAIEDLVSQVTPLRRRLDAALARLRRFQSDPLSRQPGDARRIEGLCAETARLAGRVWGLASLQHTVEWEGLQIDCVVVPESELGTFAGQPAVEEDGGRYRVRMSLDRLLEVLQREGSPEEIGAFLRFEAVRVVLGHRAATAGGEREDRLLAGSLFGGERADEALRVLGRARETSLPPSSGLTAEERWVAGVLEVPVPLKPRPSVRKIPWEDRLEHYVRSRHGATDAEVAVLRRIVTAYLERVADPLHDANSNLLEDLIREATRKKEREADVRYPLLRRMLYDFIGVAGWAVREVSPDPDGARAGMLTPEGAANLLLGDYLSVYRQLFPRQTAKERYLFLEETVRGLVRDLNGRLGASFDEEEMIGRVRDLLAGVDRREGRTLDPLPQDDEVLPQGSRWVLGPLAETPLARALLSRLRPRLVEGAVIDMAAVGGELAALADERQRFLGEVTDPAERERIQAGFMERLPVIRTYINAARSLAGREPAPEEREIMEFLYLHFLFGDSGTLFSAVEATVRRYPPEIAPQVGAAAIRWVRRRLEEERDRLSAAMGDVCDFLSMIPAELEGGSLSVYPERDLRQHLAHWSNGLFPEIRAESDWNVIVAATVLRLGSSGREGEIEAFLAEVERLEGVIAPLLETAKDVACRLAVEKAAAAAAPATPTSPSRPPVVPPAPVRLPPVAWNPDDYTHLPLAERQGFWRGVGEAMDAEVEAPRVLLYLTPEGPRVARLNQADADRFVTATRREGEGAVFRFTEQISGQEMELFTFQIRFAMRVDGGSRRFVRWMAELRQEDPSFNDARLMESLLLFLPIADQPKTDFFGIVSQIVEGRPPQRIRASLNGYTQTHRARLAGFRNYYSNMGLWHITSVVAQRLREVVGEDPVLLARMEKVFDMLDEHPCLPRELTEPLQSAVRILESLPVITGGSYLSFAQAMVEAWPEAMRRDAERLKAMLPPDQLDVADWPEIGMINSVNRMFLQARTVADIREMKGSRDQRHGRLRTYYETLKRISETQELEPLQRILFILSTPGLLSGPQVRDLVDLVNANAGMVDRSQKRERGVRALLDFYRHHRDEFLWRLRENEGRERFEWAPGVLPASMPRRHAFSGEFPELAEIGFREIDECRVYLQELTRPTETHPNVVMVNVDNNGLWRRIFLPAEQVLFRDTFMGGRPARIPLGIRIGEQTVYFRTYLSDLAGRGMSVSVDDSLGVEELRVRDVLGQEVTIRSNQKIGRIDSLSQVRSMSRTRPGVMFESAVLWDDSLRDLHPLLVMIYHTTQDNGAQDTSFFREVDQVAQEYLRNPDLIRSQADRVRRLILDGYRQFRRQFHEMGLRGRFSIHFDNPPPGR